MSVLDDVAVGLGVAYATEVDNIQAGHHVYLDGRRQLVVERSTSPGTVYLLVEDPRGRRVLLQLGDGEHVAFEAERVTEHALGAHCAPNYVDQDCPLCAASWGWCGCGMPAPWGRTCGATGCREGQRP